MIKAAGRAGLWLYVQAPNLAALLVLAFTAFVYLAPKGVLMN